MAKAKSIIISGNKSGRKSKYGSKMERQVSVGLDPKREVQLGVLQKHLQRTSISTVTESDVMRYAFDRLVASLEKGVPELYVKKALVPELE